MATVVVPPDQDAVVAEIELAAPPQRVLAALTDPAQNKEWGRSEAFQITLWEMDARVGGAWRFVSRESGKNREFVHQGSARVRSAAGIGIQLVGQLARAAQPANRCPLGTDPIADGTKVKVTHSGLAAEAKTRQDYYQGWPGLLAQLKKFLQN